MPNYSKSHEENRLKVCLVCFKRGSGMQRIGKAALPRIQRYFYANYDLKNEFLPAALCARCQGLLLDIERGNRTSEALPAPFDFSKVVPTKETRGHPKCSCCLCEIARESPIGKGLGTWKPEPHRLGRPKTDSPNKEVPPARPITICQRCHSTIGRGLSHTCTQSRWLNNICSELSRDPRGSEIHASDVLKAKLTDAGGDSPIRLATRGRSITLSVSAQSSRCSAGAFGDIAVPASEIARMQDAIGLSGRQTRQAAQFFREWKGRSSIEPNLLHRLAELNSELDPFYATESVQVRCSTGEFETRTVVFCSNVSGLVGYVLARRRMDPDPGSFLLKIGIDGGRGFFKVCMTLVRSGEQSSILLGGVTEAGSSPFAEGGVKKLIIIAAVEKVPEYYENVQTVLNLLNLEDVSFCSSVDMKLANVLLGLQSASSAHPCPWCETPRKEFANPHRSVRLRTFGSPSCQAAQYQRIEGQRSSKPSGEPFHNCIRQPLLNWPDSSNTLEAVPPMELHLLLGLVNRLYDELEQRLTALGPDGVRAAQWAEALHVRRSPYHGSQFNGNECDRLLGGVDSLRQILADHAAFSGVPVAHAFSCLRAVQQKCFGQQLLEGYDTAVKEFEAAYHALAINITPKAHALIDHVPQFLEAMAVQSGCRRGLGFWSEQAMESAHRDFSDMWSQRFKVDATHPEYARRLLRCITVYSSRHL
ncbi:hypothetical protein BOX15_Mlig010790g22 [Macrostomum lignano]|uniref:Uncharacterized protein n=1 Tax=Macrostomum lignano TaxID=282301 RepID=A0A267FX94_9PLAT|nr:hypothetical protein BOX15_Mlig010790g22 [Macrostomum lignano]